jgi:putative heme-binding domain-containing protein
MDIRAPLVYKSPMPRRALLLGSMSLLLIAPDARGQLLTVDHPGQYTREDIARGSLLYAAQCAPCHGRDGDQVSGIDLRRGLFRRSTADEDLAAAITRGTPGGMPPFALDAAELTGIIAFIRAGFDTSASVRVGDAARGRAIFEGTGECATCHRVAGAGPRVAPDLSDIGLARAPAALDRTIRDPSAALLPINRPVRIVTADGRTIRGRRLNEDTHTVQLIDDRERLISVSKADVRTFEVAKEPGMPAYAGRLTDEEIADVVAYLRTLRRP